MTFEAFGGLLCLSIWMLAPQPLAGQQPNQSSRSRTERPRTNRPAKITTIEEWRKADDELLAAAADYFKLAERRRGLLADLDKHRKRFVPGGVSPNSVRARRLIRGILQEHDELLGEFRGAIGRVWHVTVSAHYSRNELRELLETSKAELEKIASGQGQPRPSRRARGELARVRKWLLSLERPVEQGPSRIILGVLGDDLGGALLRESMSFAERRSRRGADEPSRTGPSAPAERKEWLQRRLQQLERYNIRWREMIQSRDDEIKTIREELSRMSGQAAPKKEPFAKEPILWDALTISPPRPPVPVRRPGSVRERRPTPSLPQPE